MASVSRRALIASLVAGRFSRAAAAKSGKLRAGVFRSDVTPDAGEPLIWVTPVKKVEDPLWARGVILDDGGARYVLCALDWCGVLNSTHELFRRTIAQAAGTEAGHVLVQTVHQHTAPLIDGDAEALLGKLPNPPLRMSDAFLTRTMGRLSDAVREAVGTMRPFDTIGTGQADVERVASARRFLSEDGKPITRFSTGGANPALAALPEGDIDPKVKTVTLAAGKTPLVRLHYYATHPQTFCCDGRVSGDIVSAARAAVERVDGVFQIYFTGCAGDVTVGKYNDKTAAAQAGLSRRLEQGMRAAIRNTVFAPAGPITWLVVDLPLAPKPPQPAKDSAALAELAASGRLSGAELYRAAVSLAFAERKTPLQATSLGTGKVAILHLPGEPMLAFQRYAQGLEPDRFVAVAGYGDLSPGYLCTDRAVAEGGYEPGASNAGPGVETAVKRAIRALSGDNPRRF